MIEVSDFLLSFSKGNANTPTRMSIALRTQAITDRFLRDIVIMLIIVLVKRCIVRKNCAKQIVLDVTRGNQLIGYTCSHMNTREEREQFLFCIYL